MIPKSGNRFSEKIMPQEEVFSSPLANRWSMFFSNDPTGKLQTARR
jgi:hypothetical protein